MEFSVFDILLEPTFILNSQGIVVYLNPAAEKSLEIPKRKALNNKPFLNLFKLETKFDELQRLNQKMDSVPYKECKYKTLSGTSGTAQIGVQPFINSNNEPLWIIYFRDVSLEYNLHQKYQKEMEQKEIYTRKLEQSRFELERYSETLEQKIRSRTLDLENLNSTMRALLDSLDQGFLIFEKTGKCLPVYSRSCEALLGLNPGGLYFWDTIKSDVNETAKIEKWIKSLFTQTLPFKDLASLGPERVFNTFSRSIFLNYYPIFGANNNLDGVVVVVTDKTELEVAEKAAERERAYSHMVINVVRRKKEITRYIFDVQKLLGELNEVISDHYKFHIQTALRCLHTIKSGATTFAIYDLAQACHDAEQLLFEVQKDGLSKGSLYILQNHFNKVRYEFQTFLKSNEVLLGNEVIHGKRSVEIPLETITDFLNTLKNEAQLNEKVIRFEKDIFYVPIVQFLEGFEETIQALSMKLGKKIKPLIIEGGEILIHREHYSELFTTLIHQLYNIVDHGIESPVLRRFHHKEEFGHIIIKVNIETNETSFNEKSLVIQIIDDGQGLDPVRIRERLRNKGIATNLLTDYEVLQFIFKGDLSSKEQITQISGNGIGMEAIMHTVTDLGGVAKIDSTVLKGTILTIKVPYITEQFKLVS